MNLLLLHPQDFIAPQQSRVDGRRHRHLLEQLRVEPGTRVKAGILDGGIGFATVREVATEFTLLEMDSTLADPPPGLPVTLVLALPRPKMLRRIFQAIAALGVKKLCLINSYRVEKSYWQSPWLAADAIREQLILGLEQGVDTRLPEVSLHHRFKPFVEDELPGLSADTLKLVAHPKGATPCPSAVTQSVTLAVGPEGGFIPYEVEKLEATGFLPVTLGPRVLRVETAIPALLSRLFI